MVVAIYCLLALRNDDAKVGSFLSRITLWWITLRRVGIKLGSGSLIDIHRERCSISCVLTSEVGWILLIHIPSRESANGDHTLVAASLRALLAFSLSDLAQWLQWHPSVCLKPDGKVFEFHGPLCELQLLPGWALRHLRIQELFFGGQQIIQVLVCERSPFQNVLKGVNLPLYV